MNTDRANSVLAHIKPAFLRKYSSLKYLPSQAYQGRRSFGVQWGSESAEIVNAADIGFEKIVYFPEWLGGGECFYGQHHINTSDSHNYLSAYEGRSFRSVYIESIPCARPKNLWVGESYQPFINWEI